MSILSGLRRMFGIGNSGTPEQGTGDGSAHPAMKPGRHARVRVHEVRKEDHTYVDEDGHTHHTETVLDTEASGPLAVVQRAMQSATNTSLVDAGANDPVYPEDHHSGSQAHPGLDRMREEVGRLGEAILGEVPDMLKRAFESWRRLTPQELEQRMRFLQANLTWCLTQCGAVQGLMGGSQTPDFETLERSLNILADVLDNMGRIDGKQTGAAVNISAVPLLGSPQSSSPQTTERGRRELTNKIKAHTVTITRELERIQNAIKDLDAVTPQILQNAYVALQRQARLSQPEQNRLWDRLRDELKKKGFIRGLLPQ